MVERTALYPQHVFRLLGIRKNIYKKIAELDCEAALSKEPIKKERLNLKYSIILKMIINIFL